MQGSHGTGEICNVFFPKRLRFDDVTLLQCNNYVTGPHSFLFLYQSRGNGDYMLVRHDIFSSVYLLPVRACVQVASAISQVVSQDKDPNCLSCC